MFPAGNVINIYLINDVLFHHLQPICYLQECSFLWPSPPKHWYNCNPRITAWRRSALYWMHSTSLWIIFLNHVITPPPTTHTKKYTLLFFVGPLHTTPIKCIWICSCNMTKYGVQGGKYLWKELLTSLLSMFLSLWGCLLFRHQMTHEEVVRNNWPVCNCISEI